MDGVSDTLPDAGAAVLANSDSAITAEQVSDFLAIASGVSLMDFIQTALLVLIVGLIFGLIVTRGWR